MPHSRCKIRLDDGHKPAGPGSKPWCMRHRFKRTYACSASLYAPRLSHFPFKAGPEVQPRPLGAAGGGTRGDDAGSTGSRSPVRLRTQSGGRRSRSVCEAGPGRGGGCLAPAPLLTRRASGCLSFSPCRRHGCGADPAAARLWRPERA